MKVRLKELGEIITGNTPSKKIKEFWNSEDIYFIKPDIIEDSGVNEISETKEYISEEARKKARIVTKKSIFVTCIGSIGKIGIASAGEYAFNQQINAIVPNEKVQSKYLAYNLLYNKPRLVAMANAPVVPIINKRQFGEFIVNIETDIGRQVKIVNVLDRLTHIIRLSKQELEKLDELIKARFVEMFGDMIINPNGWGKVLLGEACDVRDGTHDSPKYFTEGYPLVTSKNVTGGKIDFADCSLICEEDYNKINQRSKVDMGDILMPMIGTVGNPVIVDIEAEFAIKNVALIKFRENSTVINSFVKALLESDYFDRAVISKVRGGTQKFISLGDIRKLEICLPPIAVQEQFSDFAKQVDKSKVAVQKALDETQTLFDSLMQEYFG